MDNGIIVSSVLTYPISEPMTFVYPEVLPIYWTTNAVFLIYFYPTYCIRNLGP
jgi:hypothetical protein